MTQVFIPIVITLLISISSYAQESTATEEAFKTITFAHLNPKDSKVNFKISTTAYKTHVQLEFEAIKLEGGKFAVYKTPDCDKKNFAAAKLKKLDPKDQFFEFSTNSGNIFEERKIDLDAAAKFNIGLSSFVLIKIGKQNTAIACALKQ
ncbi:hypothetical protein CIK05_11200 [Bdellovibrio sp. qaytius]|nr:hypothetical protein CIK05_11200 [Bdellovibrio sp. qaytius]